MQEISSSLRQRLRARPEPTVHPDPDLLTAYVEQSLPSPERSQVVQHLADCSYCREIVSLSLSQIEAEAPQEVAAASGRSRWWIPAYRWAAVAATVAIAATLVIEKPWQARFIRPEPVSTLSDNVQPASSNRPSVATPTGSQPATNAPDSTPAGDRNQTAKTETASAPAKPSQHVTGAGGPVTSEDRSLKANERLAGISGGAVSGPRQAPALMPAPPPVPPKPVQAVNAQAAPVAQTSYAYKDAQPDYVKQDYVNKSFLSNQAADVITAESSTLPPEAPSPKAAPNERAAGKDPRKLREEALAASEMDVPVVPPATDAGQAPSGTDNTLAKSGGFKLRSKVQEAVTKTIETAKKVATGKSAGSSGQGFASAGFIASPADADQGTAKKPAQAVHWSITSDGRLLRSSDVGQWHQVVTQNPDVQFRVVQPHGSEVWAGGNHGTLIHSWNAGVNWSQMNLPDSSTSDVTAISIDDDNVQVKTSNGQTFVSNDHGKTWVPLQQQPQ